MSVAQLTDRDATVATRLAAARAALSELAEVGLGELDADRLGELLHAVTSLGAQVDAVRLRVLAEADRRHVADQSGAPATDAWAAGWTATTRASSARGVRLAGLLTDRYPTTREALREGRVSAEQAGVIVDAAQHLPAAATDQQRWLAERALVAKAASGMDPRRLRQAARRMLEVTSPRLADVQEGAMLAAEERSARQRTWLTLQDQPDGTVSGRFVVPELHGHLLRSALERLTAPRRRVEPGQKSAATAAPPAGSAGTGSVEAGSFGTGSLEAGEGSDGPLAWTARMGAAFCEVLEHLPTTGHGPVAATILVHLDHDRLVDGLAAARLDTGAHISAGEARRLACEAGILPVVLDSRSEPLDVGREQRLHTRAQRRALATLHDSCAAVGCERPFAWCEIHHPQAWSAGGRTSVANGVPLCGWHHRRAHDPAWTVTVGPRRQVAFHRRT